MEDVYVYVFNPISQTLANFLKTKTRVVLLVIFLEICIVSKVYPNNGAPPTFQ